MTDPFIAGAQGAVSTLKGAQNVGKDLGKIVGDQQSDMEATVREQHRKRMLEKQRLEMINHAAEFKAFQKFEQDKAHEKELQKLKATAISKYGKDAWAQIEAVKAKQEKERSAEDKLMDHDRQKQMQVFWWCMTVSALITYFFKLYK
jgi:hypothetical protein